MFASNVDDVLAIHRLSFDYAAANDDRDIDLIMACFTEDGSFGLQVAGRDPVGPFDHDTSPDLRGFMSETLGLQHDQRRHVVTNLRVTELTPDTFETTSYFTLLVTDGGVTSTLTAGVYRDTVVRGPDGRWRFATKWLDLDTAP